MKIYTKNGDDGTTSLAGGTIVPKDDIQVEAYGTIDELSAFVGLLSTYYNEAILDDIQKQLFVIGGILACENNEMASGMAVQEKAIKSLEDEIDHISGMLPEQTSFILPIGVRAACISHVCRTVCRRAERIIVTLQREYNLERKNNCLVYINRLSDYFWVLARKLNFDAGFKENNICSRER